MSRFTGVVLIAGLGALVAGLNVPPVATNVAATEWTGESKLVDIDRDLAEVDDDLGTVEVVVGDDGGITRDVPAASLTGDIGVGITPTSTAVSEGEASSDSVFPLGTALPVQRRLAVAGESVGAVAGMSADEGVDECVEPCTLVYENTLGRYAFGPSSSVGRWLADDIVTTAVAGCSLDHYVVKVSGDNYGGVGPYEVDVALFDTCPGANPDRPPIPDTECHFSLPDNGVYELSCEVPSKLSVPVPQSMFVGVSFNRTGAGVVVGAPALRGFSADTLDFPGFACSAWLGGFPFSPHASFYTQLYTRDDCRESHIAYRNSNHDGSHFSPGRTQLFADDISLGIPECKMIGYEVAYSGYGVLQVDLRRFLSDAEPENGGLISLDTRRSFSSVETNTVHVGRVEIAEPIDLPRNFFLTFKTNTTGVGPLRTCKDADIGTTGDFYMVLGNDQWEAREFSSACRAGFDFTIICEGAAPTGSCCDMFVTECIGGTEDGKPCDFSAWYNGDPVGGCAPPGTCESVCRELAEINCPQSLVDPDFQPGWVGDSTCDADPFEHPCGLSACCYMDSVGDEWCDNLTRAECLTLPPLNTARQWQKGEFCGSQYQNCPWVACLEQEGECGVPRSTPGCEDPSCCTSVCNNDPWCCRVEWDEICWRPANSICRPRPGNNYCYSGTFGGALTVVVNGPGGLQNHTHATESRIDPGFSCHGGRRPRCLTGTRGEFCEANEDCDTPGVPGSGTCDEVIPTPGAAGLGTVWYKFFATDTTARVQTCSSSAPALDSLIQVFSVVDPSTDQTACNTLTPIGCSDDEPGCGSSDRNSSICVGNLVPGDLYYVMVAVKEEEFQDDAIYRLDVTSPCEPNSSTSNEYTQLAAVAAPNDLSVALLVTEPPHPKEPRSVVVDRGGEIPDIVIPEHAVDDTTGLANSARSDGPPRKVDWDQGEVPFDPPSPRPLQPPPGVIARSEPVRRGSFQSVQVNVDALGLNIMGDAANEPSIAVDPTDPNKIVIGWRQFDSVESNFRQAGWAYSHDGGVTWTFPDVLEPGVFRSDPVLGVSSDGIFYYYSLTQDFSYDLFTSYDGGVTWPRMTPARGGDKGWMAVDNTNGLGSGNIYSYWTGYNNFTRSTDGGVTFMSPIGVSAHWGTIAVGPDGEVYVAGKTNVPGAGDSIVVARSLNAKVAQRTQSFEAPVVVDLGGGIADRSGPNPDGLLGQVWVAVDQADRTECGNVYVLASVYAPGDDPLDVMFAASDDGGKTWSAPVRVNDDPIGSGAWHWFGTMSAAPSGRIDAVWNDTRNSGLVNWSELFYAYSVDGGHTWSKNVPVSPPFDSHVGWPNQDKIGDYYHTVSDNTGVNIAYAATFNGEQDVYFLRIEPFVDCNENGIYDPDEVASHAAVDCNANLVPDECERDLDGDGVIDGCDPDIDGDGVSNENDICRETPIAGPVDHAGRPSGDTDWDCVVALNDYWRFRNCMLNGRSGLPRLERVCLSSFDTNGDGGIDLRDFATFQRTFGRP